MEQSYSLLMSGPLLKENSYYWLKEVPTDGLIIGLKFPKYNNLYLLLFYQESLKRDDK